MNESRGTAAMDDLPERVRAFVAAPLPEPVRVELGRFQERLKRELPDLSWTRPDAMHLTLRFLGNIDSASASGLAVALSEATQTLRAFTLALGEVGCFGNRVIWIGVVDGAEPLGQLAERIRITSAPFSAHEENRAFNAHVTLGRSRQPTPGVAAALRRLAPPHCRPWVADHFELIRSELSPHGSRYTTLAAFPLR